MFVGLDYHYPNPWFWILGRANESKIEIDGIRSKALIDSGAMILMMSKEYCDTQVWDTTFGLTGPNRRQWRGRCS